LRKCLRLLVGLSVVEQREWGGPEVGQLRPCLGSKPVVERDDASSHGVDGEHVLRAELRGPVKSFCLSFTDNIWRR
jgi:hypothetical protein